MEYSVNKLANDILLMRKETCLEVSLLIVVKISQHYLFNNPLFRISAMDPWIGLTDNKKLASFKIPKLKAIIIL